MSYNLSSISQSHAAPCGVAVAVQIADRDRTLG